MKIGINYKRENPEILNLIKSESAKYGLEIDNDNPDVVFSIGGDGTFLKTVHKYFDKLDKISFVGINSGTLGFFYDFVKEDIPEIMKLISKEKFTPREYPLLCAKAKYENESKEVFAINEIRIENPFHTISCNVLVDDELLESFRGNGLVVSSSLGSSGYNKSLGGSLIDHDLCALEITEVAGLQNRVTSSLHNSLILSGNKKIVFNNIVSPSILGYDHLSIQDEEELQEVVIGYSDKKVKIIYKDNHSYTQRIRKSFVL